MRLISVYRVMLLFFGSALFLTVRLVLAEAQFRAHPMPDPEPAAPLVDSGGSIVSMRPVDNSRDPVFPPEPPVEGENSGSACKS